MREHEYYNLYARGNTHGVEKDVEALKKVLRYQKRRIDDLLKRVRQLEKKGRKA